MIYRSASLLLGLLFLAPTAALAEDPAMDATQQCTRALPRYERSHGIPGYLLLAIASTESGRWHDKLKATLPWPWTINADGKGYFYPTKEKAIAAAKAFKAQGVHNMDIGCMQVSLLHHPNAFASLEEAFEPETNVAYAATFLRGLFDEAHDWQSAASAYHSKEPYSGAEYYSRVYGQWRSITDRIRHAAGKYEAGDYAAAVATTVPSAHSQGERYAQYRPASHTQSSYKGSSIKVITIRSAVSETPASHDNGVLVLSPTPIEPLPAAAPQAVNMITPTPSAGPRFIFSD